MNYIKAQKEIFQALCQGIRQVGCFKIDENNILVTPNGYMAYIFPITSILFSIEKAREITPFPISEIIKPENKLELTSDCRILESFDKRMLRRLKGEGKNVFVNVKYLGCFQNPKFYQEKNKLSTIVVTEDISATKTNLPVGIILPVRCDWADDYYADNLADRKEGNLNV